MRFTGSATIWRLFPKFRFFHTNCTSLSNEELRRIRNIGILAHIDAGKTTTTERMLYYSGKISHMGEVHHGNTVTDYLEQERNRGITITSASVTIPWLNHQINIIDTPGHIDFTFEVEQSLRVIDGAIIILDGSAGVEAQTITVWRQADHYNIPRIVYVNKMDRLDSSLDNCLAELKLKFGSEFLALQVPVRGSKSGITAIVDIVSKDILSWSGNRGEKITRTPLNEGDTLYDEVQKLRDRLIDKLAALDDELAECILADNSLSKVGVVPIYNALRRVTIDQKAVVVVCGSSYKNIGVQKLMDAVIQVLPSPVERDDLKIYKSFGTHLCAQAFKIVHDKNKGPVTFFRIYSGSMNKGQRLYLVNKERSEQIQKLMIALADDYSEMKTVSQGNIVAVTGLKAVSSGDFVTESATSMNNATRNLSKELRITEDECRKLLCPRMVIPEPVFFCSIEAPSLSQQPALDVALEELQREDPSLRVKLDEDTKQTILGGMGELHLEIVKDRILKKYNVDADTGPLQIAYKELLLGKGTNSHHMKLVVGTETHSALISLTMYPREDGDQFVKLDPSLDNLPNRKEISSQRLKALTNAFEMALQRGPKVGCPVLNAAFILHQLEAKKYVSDSVLSSVASQCVQQLLGSLKTALMEPVMKLVVVTDDEQVGFVMSDLSRRRAEICELSSREKLKQIRAIVPLSELLGYSKSLRIGSSGHASFTMEFDSYRQLNGMDESEAIKNITGFYPQ